MNDARMHDPSDQRRPPARPTIRYVAIGALVAALAVGGTGIAWAQSAQPSAVAGPSGGPPAPPPFGPRSGGPHGPGGPGGAGGHVTISAINGQTLTLKTDDSWTRQVTVGPTTTYRRAGQAITVGDLHPGDAVHVRQQIQADGSVSIVGVDVALPKLDGQVTAVSGTSLTLQRPDGSTKTAALTGSTTYVKFGQPAKASDVTTGDRVHAEGALDSAGNFTALVVRIDAPKVDGSVTKVDGSTITVQPRRGPAGGARRGSMGGPAAAPGAAPAAASGDPRAILTNAQTTFTRAGQVARLSDVTSGSDIHAEGTITADGSFTAAVVRIQLPKRHGVVAKVDGGTITVRDRDQTFAIATSGATTFTTDDGPGTARKSATLSDVKVGGQIDAEGTLNADGTLNALLVSVKPGP